MVDYQKTGSQAFGELLRRAREYLGVSRKELAELTGLSYPYISQLETGYRLPSTAAMQKFVDVLPTSLDELYAAISQGRDEDDAEASARGPDQVRSDALFNPAPPPARSLDTDRWVTNESFASGAPNDLAEPSVHPLRMHMPSEREAARPRLPAPAPAAAPGGGMRNRAAAPRKTSPERDLAERIVDLLSPLPVDDQLEVMARVQARVMRRAIDEQVGRAQPR